MKIDKDELTKYIEKLPQNIQHDYKSRGNIKVDTFLAYLIANVNRLNNTDISKKILFY